MDVTGLTDEQQQLQATARRFAEREIRSVADRLDAGEHGPDAIRDYREVFKRAVAPGFIGLTIPTEHGGSGGGALDVAVVGEELGAVDVGLGSSLTLAMTVSNVITAAADPDHKEQLLEEITSGRRVVLSGALNEPDIAGSELFCPDPDPALGMRTIARRDGDHYVISGQKAAFVTNGGVADAYLVFARTSLDRPFQETATVFWVPAETEGISSGQKTRLLGMRGSWHAEVVLDEVRVPASHRLGPEGAGPLIMATATASMVIGLAAAYVGLARTATAYALEYASTRHSWGRPIREHQAVALQLADAAIDVETARLLVHRAARAVDAGDPAAAAVLCPAAKVQAVDVAIRCAERCVRILGGYGVSEEFPAQRFLRDAWAGYACDFTGDMLRLGIAGQL